MSSKRSTEEAIGGIPVHYLRVFAAFLALMVAGIHLLHPRLGLPRLVEHLQVGLIADPRPAAFTVVGVAILAGIALVWRGVLVRQVYAGGIGLMLGLLVGYVAWHTVLDHGAFWPHIEGHGHGELGLLETVWHHLATDTIAFVTKVYELVLLVVLAVLLSVDSTATA